MYGRTVKTDKITGFGGKIIGYVDTDQYGNQRVKGFDYKIKGYYDKNTDTTRDWYGHIMAHGNQVLMFLYKDNKDIR